MKSLECEGGLRNLLSDSPSSPQRNKLVLRGRKGPTGHMKVSVTPASDAATIKSKGKGEGHRAEAEGVSSSVTTRRSTSSNMSIADLDALCPAQTGVGYWRFMMDATWSRAYVSRGDDAGVTVWEQLPDCKRMKSLECEGGLRNLLSDSPSSPQRNKLVLRGRKGPTGHMKPSRVPYTGMALYIRIVGIFQGDLYSAYLVIVLAFITLLSCYNYSITTAQTENMGDKSGALRDISALWGEVNAYSPSFPKQICRYTTSELCGLGRIVDLTYTTTSEELKKRKMWSTPV
ncbi:hypothetical protein DFP72DRAFT_843194 [Ephemerocybe angulata]|uniref:Uncharacterized protein n=1 Tax=Ephemerocybe angulata TaxID=980116 RepID=A0A8H6I8K7_9AGAR|nr:hypothetical protein DFP72DRAFT_843194 [Tulosesus angulatus]